MKLKIRTPVDPRQASLILRALRSFPSEEPGQASWGESYAGAPYLRYQARTGGISWLVDIYGRGYCRVQIGSSLSQIKQSIPSLMRHLYEQLGDLT